MPVYSFPDLRSALPEGVSAQAIKMAKQHRIRKIRFEHAKKVYFGEDENYWFLQPDGHWNVLKVGGEWGGYTNTQFISKEAPIPVGGYVIEEHLFLGKWFITVYHNNGVEALPKGGEAA